MCFATGTFASVSLCFHCSSVCLSVFVVESSPLTVCSPASHQFPSLQFIYPGSSPTHRQIAESASGAADALGFVSRSFQVGRVLNCCFSLSLQLSWSTASSPHHPPPFPTFLAIKPTSFISTLVCVCVWVPIANHNTR